MWAFKTFPEILEDPLPLDSDSTYQVEVFGYLDLNKEIISFFGGYYPMVELMAFRTIKFSLQKYIGNIEFLPIDEFQNRFKNYTLVNKC